MLGIYTFGLAYQFPPAVPPAPSPTPHSDVIHELKVAEMSFYAVGAVFARDQGQALECWKCYLELQQRELIRQMEAAISGTESAKRAAERQHQEFMRQVDLARASMPAPSPPDPASA